MSPQHEKMLATKFPTCWNRRGHTPRVWAEHHAVRVSDADEQAIWVVRSDLIGGCPLLKPRHPSNLQPAPKSDSPAAVLRLAGTTHPGKQIESVRPSQNPWRGKAVADG